MLYRNMKKKNHENAEMQKNIFDDVTLWYSSIRDTETLFIEILNKQNKNIIVGLIYSTSQKKRLN